MQNHQSKLTDSLNHSLVTSEHPAALRYFTTPDILRQLDPRRINKLLRAFADEFTAVGITLPDHESLNGEYHAAVGDLFGGPLPERLRTTMTAIEAAATPENTAHLDALIVEHIPNVAIDPAIPLDCALELWFHAPDALSQFAPASTSASVSASPGIPAPELAASSSLSSFGGEGKGEEASSLHDTNPPIQQSPPSPGSLLLDALAATLRRFVILPEWAAETLALWILHTYAFQLRDVCTYIGIESPEKQCGKTTLLTVLSELVHRAITASNISSSAFFRVIEDLRPTLMIDEADTFLRGNEQLKGILNAGYKRKTAYVLRAVYQGSPDVDAEAGKESVENQNSKVSADGAAVMRFSAWCPKLISQIGHLPETLADRCIVIRMQRKAPNETCERLRNLDAEALVKNCARFVADHKAAIAEARPEPPAGLSDRAAEIWEPLFVIADIAGGDWPEKARQAALALSAAAQESNPRSSLLLDIFVLFVVTGEQRMFTRRMVEDLFNRFVDRRWAELAKGVGNDARAQGQWLSQQLKPYGIKPRNMWVNGEQGKGYDLEDFHETFRRYIPRAELEALKAEAQQSNEGTKAGNSTTDGHGAAEPQSKR